MNTVEYGMKKDKERVAMWYPFIPHNYINVIQFTHC